MKIENVMPDWAMDEINRLNGTISTIRENYLGAVESCTTTKMAEKIMQSMMADPAIHICEKRIAEIYMCSVPTIIITAESNEDRERLEGLLKSL